MINKKLTRTLFATSLLAAAGLPSAQAQNDGDALRYSFLQPQGTARSIGIGSALGSVGGDFTALAVNPAGIGIYRRSEIMFTPSLTIGRTGADYSGASNDETGSHFAISNIGLVSTKTIGSGGGGSRQKSGRWTAVAFGIGMTRVADFTRDYSYGGTNTTSSGSFVFEADARIHSPFNSTDNTTLADLGYQTFLLDTTGSGNQTLSSVVRPLNGAKLNVSQLKTVKERGGISELGVTVGGTYDDRVMIGGTLGFPIVRYTRTKTFTERDVSGNTNNDFDYFTYNNELRTNGAGINLKLGAIYKFSDNFRLGAAIHTPTYLSLSDVENNDLSANTEGFAGARNARELENQYDYSISTPWRGLVSATALFGGFGFITADYEYVDYKSARFNFDAADKDYQHQVNEAIKNNLQGASNIRAGIEIRLENIQLRGGFGYYGNPYSSGIPYSNGNVSGERIDISGGIGFRFSSAFIDLGFVHHQYKSSDQPYSLSGTTDPASRYYGLVIPTAQLNTGNNNAVLTVGFKL